MSKYDIRTEKENIEQRLCNVISYVLMLYRTHKIDEKTKNDLLKICNPNVYYKERELKYERKKENFRNSNSILQK